ncbi:MAG: RNA polymerase sigma factor [Chloroflexota bacterium]
MDGSTTAAANGAERADGGGNGEFAALLERHGPEVYRFLLRLTRNPSDADDLYQEAALRACRAFGRLDARANQRAWFFRIAGNAYLSDRRKHARVQPLGDAAAGALAAPADDEDARTDAAAALARVLPLIDGLPRKQRMALVARKGSGLSYPEIAVLLGCSEAAARANVHAAVRSLRAGLGDLLD